MNFDLDKEELDNLSDEELGQHFRYILGESEYTEGDASDDEADEDASEEDMNSDNPDSSDNPDDSDESEDGQDIEDYGDWPVDDMTGLPKRLTVADMEKLSDSKLGKLVRTWLKQRLARKSIDLLVFGSEQEADAEELAEKGQQDGDKTYALKDVAIFATGEYKKKKWTLKHLRQIKANYDKFKGKITPPLKIGHGVQPKIDTRKSKSEQPAAGWVTALRLKGNKLYADLANIPKVVYDLLVKKAYKRLSSEIYIDFKDDTGKNHGPALAAVALLGTSPPAIKSLPEIDARYAELAEENETETVEFALVQDLILAEAASGSDAEDTEGGLEDMADEERDQELSEEEAEDSPTGSEKPDEKEEKPDEKEETSESTDTESPDPNIAKLLSENSALRERVQQLEQAFKDEQREKRHIEEKALVEKLKEDGRLLPANEVDIYRLFDAYADDSKPVKFAEKADDGTEREVETTAYKLFRAHLEKLPQVVDYSERSPASESARPGKASSDKKSKGEPDLDVGETWTGEDLHGRIVAYMEANPEKVKEYAEANGVSEYEAAMDLIQQ
jgi:hypothetical protein